MKEFQKYRRIVVCAHQAGGAALLAALLAESPRRFRATIYAYRPAAPFFTGRSLECVVVDKAGRRKAREILSTQNPEAVFLGASIGSSLEKALMVEARLRDVPVFSFVDHYWNLWQRFAHEKTAARWYYLPTRIYVIDRRSRERIIALGCPADLARVHPHPALKFIRSQPAQLSSREVRRRLGIPEHSMTALFISEWEYRVSARWRYEQPKRTDVIHLLLSLLKAAQRLQRKGPSSAVVLIKKHPAEGSSWNRYLRSFDPSLYRVIGQFDKPSLLDASDVVFGLNSMMMLEALARGRKAYSLRKSRTSGEAWLSMWNRRIGVVRSATDCERVLRRVRANS